MHSYLAITSVLALLAGLVALLFVFFRDRTPVLTPEGLERARATWRHHQLLDYDITLLKKTDMRAPERDKTEVRGGKATRLFVDGTSVPVRDAYSIQGLFDLMERELEMASSKPAAPGQPEGAVLKASFHSLGFPLIFKRIAPKHQSVAITVEKVETPEGRAVTSDQ